MVVLICFERFYWLAILFDFVSQLYVLNGTSLRRTLVHFFYFEPYIFAYSANWQAAGIERVAIFRNITHA
jgi:hypothetical protein